MEDYYITFISWNRELYNLNNGLCFSCALIQFPAKLPAVRLLTLVLLPPTFTNVHNNCAAESILLNLLDRYSAQHSYRRSQEIRREKL